MRRFNLLLIVLWLCASVFRVHGDMAEPSRGHIGSALERAKDSGFLTVEYVAANSPAANANIKKGDCITAIDGISTRQLTLTQAWHFLTGNIGGIVTLTVRRQGTEEREVSVVRRSLLETYLSAATAGDPSAELYVGRFYSNGPISDRNFAKAVEWYRKAADQGFAPAQGYLGYMYLYGFGLSKDSAAAVSWLLKGAKQGDCFAERELALCYLHGVGVRQSDREAFNWFYAAAKQDDSEAENHLGYLYETGRGVTRGDREAFAWDYRSAEQDNFYGEWGLAFHYETGRGVKQSINEALKWYRSAHAGLPENGEITKAFALISLRAFVENRDYSALDLSLILSAFQREILYLFLLLAAIYIVVGIVLLYFSFKAPVATPRLFVAIGWIAFYVESQGVALLALFFLGKLLTADVLIVAISLFSALPVIASSCGPQRSRIWKHSQVAWKTLVLYGTTSCLAILTIGLGYDKIYELMTHSTLSPQPTLALLIKARNGSVLLAYASIAFILPIAEEIIFRSYLFDALRLRYSGKLVVIITALAFSLVHFQGTYFVPLFGFGLILGWLRLRTDSLRLPVLLHAINNGLFLAFAG